LIRWIFVATLPADSPVTSPIDAASTEQTYRAELLYLRSGAGAWPFCGHLLFT